jgi:hypothetical protein
MPAPCPDPRFSDIAIGPDGRGAILMHSSNGHSHSLLYVQRVESDGTLEAPTRIADVSGGVNNGSRIVIDDAGDVTVAWAQIAGFGARQLWARKLFPNGTLGPTVAVSAFVTNGNEVSLEAVGVLQNNELRFVCRSPRLASIMRLENSRPGR